LGWDASLLLKRSIGLFRAVLSWITEFKWRGTSSGSDNKNWSDVGATWAQGCGRVDANSLDGSRLYIRSRIGYTHGLQKLDPGGQAGQYIENRG